MSRCLALGLAFSLSTGVVVPARAAAVPALLAPPVDAVIERYFEAPASKYGPGHRGVDYGVPAGTRVRAAAAGRVSWSGSVAGNLSVTVDHGDGLETTYSILSGIDVIEGTDIDQGHFIGTTGSAHDGDGGLHFGVKLRGRYVDPLDYLGPADVSGAIHLAPLVEDERDEIPFELTLANENAGALARPCKNPAHVSGIPPPPNDNIAVSIAGINSYTAGGTNAKIYERGNGPGTLGYAKRRIFRFSYAGVNGAGFHTPYGVADTWADLNRSARRLKNLLIRLRERFPAADVDLFAHSQGGLVARAMLERLAQSYDPRLPRVEHLVTYGTPHRGTPLAALPKDLKGTSFTGGLFLNKMSEWANDSGVVPDPESKALEQMRPDSVFLAELASEDVTYGTRVLSLAMPHDAIVPADRALYPGELGRMLPPESINGHDAVVTSEWGRSIAYSFLRDAPVSCVGGWDTWGPAVGSAIGWAQGLIADLYSSLETAGLLKVLGAARWAAGKGWAALKWTGRSLVDGARSAGRMIRAGWSALW